MWSFFSRNAKSSKNKPVLSTLTYAVGDIHGRLDLLERLLDLIQIDRNGRDAEIVFLGDYIDRGADSAGVVEALATRKGMEGLNPIFLKGNHEATLIEFLKSGQGGPAWAKFGGLEALASYGVRPPKKRTNRAQWLEAHAQLQKAIPEHHLEFLEKLELTARRGPYLFVHAGIDPNRPISEQGEAEFLWIRKAFLTSSKRLEAIVVHGHSVTGKPKRSKYRIGVDTGAYMSGHLTAVKLLDDRVDFIAT